MNASNDDGYKIGVGVCFLFKIALEQHYHEEVMGLMMPRAYLAFMYDAGSTKYTR
jgi:hypothetical protein